MEKGNAFILVLNYEGEIVHLNAACIEAFGYSVDDVRGRCFWKVFTVPGNTLVMQEALKEVLEGRTRSHQHLWYTREGEGKAIAWTGTLNGEQVLIVGLDVTASNEPNAHYRSLFQNNHSVMLLIDHKTGKIVDANPAALKFYGYSHGELIQKTIFEINTLSKKEIFEEMEQAHSEQRSHFFFKHRLASGEVRAVEVYSGPIRVQGRDLLYSLIHDITPRRQAESALQESEHFLQSTLDALTSHVAILDEKGEILAVNAPWRSFADDNELQWNDYGVGINYLYVCDAAFGNDAEEAGIAAQGIREVIAGERETFYLEYPCHSPTERRWFGMYVTCFKNNGHVRVVVAHDNITARREAEDAVRESEARYRAISELVSDYAYAIRVAPDGTMKWEWATQAVTQVMRQNPTEADQIDWYNRIHPEDLPRTEEHFQRLLRNEPDAFTYRIYDEDGNLCWLRSHARPEWDAQEGRVVRIFGASRDVTESKEAQAALEAERQRLFALLEELPAFVCLLTPDHTIRFANRYFRERFGDPQGSVCYNVIAGLNVPCELCPTRRVFREQKPVEWEWNTNDGKVYQLYDYPFTDVDGSPLVLEMGINVTARKETEEALRQSEEKYRTLVENLNDVIFTLDHEGHFVYVSPTVERLTGYQVDEIVGQPFHYFVHPEDRERISNSFKRSIVGESRPQEFRALNKGGDDIYVRTNSRMVMEGPEAVYLTGIITNITERRQAEESLAREAAINATMAELSQALISSASLEEISYLVLERAKELTGSRYGFVGYMDTEKNTFVSVSMTRDVWDKCDVPDKTIVFHKFSGLWGWVLEHRETVMTNAPFEDPRSCGIPQGHIPVKRFLGAPAILGDRLVGQVALINPPKDYTAQDVMIVERLASLYALAVQRHEIEKALQQYAEEQATLYAIAAAVASLRDPRALLNHILEIVLAVLQAEAGWVLVPTMTSLNETVILVHRGIPGPLIERLQNLNFYEQAQNCSIYRTLRECKNKELCTLTAGPCPYIEDELSNTKLESHICIPLGVGNELLGVMTVLWHSKEPRIQFGRSFVAAIGQQIGVALNNAQLYQAARQVNRLEVLNNLDAALVATLDPARVTYETLQQISRALNTSEGALFFCRSKTEICMQHSLVLADNQIRTMNNIAQAGEMSELMHYLKEHPETMPLLTQDSAQWNEDPQHPEIPLDSLVAPVWNDEGLVGLLMLNERKEQRHYSEEDRALIQAAASRAGQALQNARLYESSRNQSHRLSILNAVSEVAVASLDMDSDNYLKQILHLATRAVDADTGSILLIDDENGDLVFTLTLDERSENLKGIRLKPGQGVAGWVAQHNAALIVPNVQQDPRFYDGVDRVTGFETRSLLSVPMRHRDQVVGIIQLVNKRLGNFSKEDLNLLEAVAAIAAVALENSRLYAKTRDRATELAMLNEIGLTLTSNLDVSEVVEESLAQVRHLFQADGVSLLRRDPMTGELFFERTFINDELRQIPLRLPPGEGVTGRALRERKPQLINDATLDPDFVADAEPYLNDVTRSMMLAPLMVQDHAIGVLAVGSRKHKAYTSEDLNTLQALASTLAVALENAQLYEELKLLLREREEAQETLVHTEKMAALGRLVASIAHEINNPLQAVQGCLTLASEELVDIALQLPSEQNQVLNEYLQIAETEIDRISVIVRHMRDFYRPARQEIQKVDLHEVLVSVLTLTNKQLQHSNIVVERSWANDLPTIQANADHLKQVLLNLVLNAIDAMSSGGKLRIETERTKISTHDGKGHVPGVQVRLTDNGVGIPTAQIPRLFEPFHTTKANGTGLGLSISYGIIKAHDGDIRVTSQTGEGTTITVMLPLEQ